MAISSQNLNLDQNFKVLLNLGFVGDLSDGQLLERFTNRQGSMAEAAFTVLVRRHGPMVFRVCRTILDDLNDAEDAVQATFLVLVRQAGLVRKRESIASWLHGTASRVARRARADAYRRHVRERRAAKPEAIPHEVGKGLDEGCPELHEEIARLPEIYRAPIVLCYLEGLTTEAAARRLNSTQGTILCRLSRARERLRIRLGRRGMSLPAGLTIAGLVSSHASAAIPTSLVASTVQSALRFATGGTAATAVGIVSIRGLASTIFRFRTTLMTKLTLLGAVLLGGSVVVVAPYGLMPRSQAVSRTGDERPRDAKPGESRVVEAVEAKGVVQTWTDAAMVLAFSPDAKTVAAGCGDSTVKLYDVPSGRLRATLEWPTLLPRSVAFSPDGRMLLAVGDGNNVCLWNPLTGELRRKLTGFDGAGRAHIQVNSGVFSPDGKRILVGGGSSDQGEVKLMDVESGLLIWSHTLPDDPVMGVAFAPDGATVAIAQIPIKKKWDVEVRDASTGELVRILRMKDGSAYNLDFSRDGMKLVCGGGRRGEDGKPVGQTTIWDYRSGNVLRSLDGPSHGGAMAVFSPDGRTVAAGGTGPVVETSAPTGWKVVSEVILWNSETNASVWKKLGGLGAVTSLAFSPDGNLLACCDNERLVLRNTKTGELVQTLARTKQVDRPARPQK